MVVKGALSGIANKARVGAVEVGTGAGARAAAQRIAANVVQRAPAYAQLEWFLVERMVHGTELLGGLTRDPAYGPMLTVGVGGSLAESVRADTTIALPADLEREFWPLLQRAQLARWAYTLAGPTQERLRDCLARLAEAFVTGGLRDQEVVETNPLFVTGTGEVLAGDVPAVPVSAMAGARDA